MKENFQVVCIIETFNSAAENDKKRIEIHINILHNKYIISNY